MTLNYLYRQIFAYTILLVLSWNIVGWTVIGLGTAYMMRLHEAEHTCEIVFCYCEIVDGQKICTCHHKELHDRSVLAHFNELEHIETETKAQNTFCYYTATHSNETTSFQMIIWKPLVFLDQTNTDKQFYLLAEPFLHSVIASLSEGYTAPLLEPPIG